LIKFIEQWGKGTNRIIDEMRQNNLAEPLFQNLSGGFDVTLIAWGSIPSSSAAINKCEKRSKKEYKKLYNRQISLL